MAIDLPKHAIARKYIVSILIGQFCKGGYSSSRINMLIVYLIFSEILSRFCPLSIVFLYPIANNTVVPNTSSQRIDIMAAYHEQTTLQVSTILVVELANDNYEIVSNNKSFFLVGNDLSNYLNNLSPTVKVTYQFLEDFS